MARLRLLAYALIVSFAAPTAAASAQLPAPGPLLPPEFAAEPERIPPRPAGSSPADWARCVAERPAPAPVVPPGIDPRGIDPASPNPLLGQRWFVDRTEPAYKQWVRWRRAAGQSGRARSGA